MNWYIVLIMFSICFVKFMFICIWKRMRDMNDKLIASIILRWAIFISIWLTLNAPVNTTINFDIKFCTGIYNDHDKIMNSNNPNQTLLSPYAPILILIYFSIIILTVSIWFRQFKNSAIEPLAAKSPFVQRPKDMESMLVNFSLVNLIAINSVVTVIWKKYENYKIIRISPFLINIFFSSTLPNEMAIYPNWLILYINKIVVPVVLLVIIALKILMKYGRDLQREFWT